MSSDRSAGLLWRRYEQTVQKMLAALDPEAQVLHDARIEGRLSLASRQIDVWVRGSVIGMPITVAVECKRHRRTVDVGTVDELIGKLLDVGADRGLLYSFSGFTNAAVSRAANASNPSVMAVALKTPKIVTDARGVPGYPPDLLVQDMAPQWVEELDEDAYRHFLQEGGWSKFWT